MPKFLRALTPGVYLADRAGLRRHHPVWRDVYANGAWQNESSVRSCEFFFGTLG